MSFATNVGVRDGDDSSLKARVRERSLQVLGPTYAYDAFARLRTANPMNVFESKLTDGKAPLLWDEKLYGGGTSTHSSAEARTRLETSSSGDAAIRQTFGRPNYSPGKSQQIYMTFASMGTDANVRKRAGLFESSDAADSVPQNGIYLENDGGTVTFNIAKNGSVTETVAQANWNVDVMDGTGDSGLTLDLDDAQIMFIDFAWLGVGVVRVGFIIAGVPVTVHQFLHANVDSGVYTSTPNLPLNYSIYQDGAGAGTLDVICSSIVSEGGALETWSNFSARTGAVISCSTALTSYPIIAIRNSDPSSKSINPYRIGAISNSANDEFYLEILRNPTISGGSFSFSAVTNSVAQVALGNGTLTASGGTKMFSQPIVSGDSVALGGETFFPPFGKAIDGTLDELVLVATPISTNVDVAASIDWKESV